MAVPNSLRAMHTQFSGQLKKGNMYAVDIDLLQEEAGFNTRDYEREEVKAHIEHLATAYLAGEDLGPLEVKVIDGTIYLRDGHCRNRAIRLANSRGAKIERVNVLPVSGDENAQDKRILTSNDNLKLNALERAAVYLRMHNRGLSIDEVASEVGRSVPHVSQLLSLLDLPFELKKFINNGDIAATEALKVFNEHGTKAVEMVKALVEPNEGGSDTPKEGDDKPQKKKKVTAKSLAEADGYRSRLTPKFIRRTTDQLGSLVTSLQEAVVEGDEYLLRLPKSAVEELMKTHAELLPSEAK